MMSSTMSFTAHTTKKHEAIEMMKCIYARS